MTNQTAERDGERCVREGRRGLPLCGGGCPAAVGRCGVAPGGRPSCCWRRGSFSGQMSSAMAPPGDGISDRWISDWDISTIFDYRFVSSSLATETKQEELDLCRTNVNKMFSLTYTKYTKH